MPDTPERPLDEFLFGPTPAPPAEASLAELLTAWYRAAAAKLADAATYKLTDRTRPDTDHPKSQAPRGDCLLPPSS